MGAIDEAPEVVWRAVEARRRVQIHAVVSPAEFPGKFGHRHDLDHGYSQPREFVEFARGRRPRAFARERPDVHFINDLAAQIHAAPVMIGPSEALRIDDLRRAVRAFGLIARSRIRIEPIPAVQTEAVKGAGAHRPAQSGEITLTFRRQLKCPAAGATFGPTLDDDLDRL